MTSDLPWMSISELKWRNKHRMTDHSMFIAIGTNSSRGKLKKKVIKSKHNFE